MLIEIKEPRHWISSITFLRKADDSASPIPDTMMVYVANGDDKPIQINSVKIWAPKDNSTWQILWPQASIPSDVRVEPAEKRGIGSYSGFAFKLCSHPSFYKRGRTLGPCSRQERTV